VLFPSFSVVVIAIFLLKMGFSERRKRLFTTLSSVSSSSPPPFRENEEVDFGEGLKWWLPPHSPFPLERRPPFPNFKGWTLPIKRLSPGVDLVKRTFFSSPPSKKEY